MPTPTAEATDVHAFPPYASIFCCCMLLRQPREQSGMAHSTSGGGQGQASRLAQLLKVQRVPLDHLDLRSTWHGRKVGGGRDSTSLGSREAGQVHDAGATGQGR